MNLRYVSNIPRLAAACTRMRYLWNRYAKLSRCLVMDVYSDSDIPAFWRYATKSCILYTNAFSVLCVSVGMRLVISDLTVGTMFTQPLAGNGRLRQLHYSGFIGRNVDNISCMNYVSYFSCLEYNQPPSSWTHWRDYKCNALGNFNI
jgi:hypothetical protein